MILRILHLSDMHLNTKKIDRFTQNIVSKSLLEKIGEFISSGNEFHIILITGDLVYNGLYKEYILAKQFVNELLAITKLTSEQLFIIPGNHDVNRSNVNKSTLSKLVDFKSIKELDELFLSDHMSVISKKLGNFYKFNNKVMTEQLFTNSEYWFCEELDFDEKKIFILGMNSAILSGYDKDDKKNLALGPVQVNNVINSITKDSDLVITLMHHPFECMNQFDINNKTRLLEKTDILLTGHSHQTLNLSQFDGTTNTIIIGAGAFIENEQNKNAFNIIELDIVSNSGKVMFFEYLQKNNTWIPNLKVNPKIDDGIFNFSFGDLKLSIPKKADKEEILIQKQKKKPKSSYPHFSTIWKKSSKITPIEVLGPERGSSRFGYKEFYYEREEDNVISEIYKEQSLSNALIIGPPLSGKSRLVYEFIKQLKEQFDVIIPVYSNYDLKNFDIPENENTKKLLILDDLHIFVNFQNFDYLFKKFLEGDISIIATCRSGVDYKKVKDYFLDINMDLENIFSNIIKMTNIEEVTGQEIAEELNVDWENVSFNGTIGSVLFPLKEMKRRYENKCTNLHKAFLKSIKTAYLAGLFKDRYKFPIKWLKKIALDKYKLNIEEYDWEPLFDELKSLELIQISGKYLITLETYLETIIDPTYTKIHLSEINDLKAIFWEDELAILLIISRLFYYGLSENNVNYFKAVVKNFEEFLFKFKTIELSIEYFLIKQLVGRALLKIAEKERKIENSKKAIKTFKGVIRKLDPEKNPKEFANFNRYLGKAYVTLAEKDIKSSHLLRAITSFLLSVKYFTQRNDPIMHALLYIDLSQAYNDLSDIENEYLNLDKSIKSLKKASKLLLDNDHIQLWAYAKRILGNNYLDFALTAIPVYFIKKAIDSFNEIMEKFKDSKNILAIALSFLNLGLAYNKLSIQIRTVENCKTSLEFLESALNFDIYDDHEELNARILAVMSENYQLLSNHENPISHLNKSIELSNSAIELIDSEVSQKLNIEIHYDLAKSYRFLAKNNEPIKNVKKSIEILNDLLKNKYIKNYPYRFFEIKLSLGDLYLELSEHEKEGTNVKKAFKIFKEILHLTKKYPKFHAYIQFKYAYILLVHTRRVDSKEFCKKSINLFKESLKTFNKRESPYRYIQATHGLASSYLVMSQYHDKEKNLDKAGSNCNIVLNEIDIEYYPSTYINCRQTLAVVYCDKKDKRAIELLEELKVYKPDSDRIWYNLACSYSIFNCIENSIDALRIAINLDSSNKERAKRDVDFKNIRNLEEFKELIE